MNFRKLPSSLLALLITGQIVVLQQPSAPGTHYYPTSVSDYQYITYPAGPTPNGLTVTAHASANTKGLYTEVIASTTFASNRISVVVTQTAAANGRQYLLDIAVGPSNSEVVVLSNIPIDGFSGSSLRGGLNLSLPLSIAAGSRISARVQASTGASAINLSVILGRVGNTPVPSSYITLGANTATSRGTAVDPGGVVNTKGLYTEFVASSAAIIQIMAVIIGNNGNTDPTSTWWYVDISIGAALSEVVIIPDLPFTIGESSSLPARAVANHLLFPYIPAGTRIALRASSSVTQATDRVASYVLLVAAA